MNKLSAHEAKDLLDYDPATGIFCWRSRAARCVKIGSTAGHQEKNGYKRIMLRRKPYLAHRLAWLITYGEWPSGQVDHIDGNRSNNSISNLRLADASTNRANSKMARTNKSGFKGVCLVDGRWISSIKHHGVSKYLGSFDDPQTAHAAYVLAAKNIYGHFARAA